MSDKVIAWLRTVIPGVWSMLIAWAVSHGIPEPVTSALDGLGAAFVFPVVLAAVYPLLRKAEAYLPDWLTRILLGSAKAPTYTSEPQPPASWPGTHPMER